MLMSDHIGIGRCFEVRPFVAVYRYAWRFPGRGPQGTAERHLCFTQDEVVDAVEFLILGGEERAAGNDLRPEPVAPGDDFLGRVLLHDHGADKNVVCPRICPRRAARSRSCRPASFPTRPGSMAATVSKPRGGKLLFLETNFRACLKLQKVSGYDGYTSRIFKSCPPLSAIRTQTTGAKLRKRRFASFMRRAAERIADAASGRAKIRAGAIGLYVSAWRIPGFMLPVPPDDVKLRLRTSRLFPPKGSPV